MIEKGILLAPFFFLSFFAHHPKVAPLGHLPPTITNTHLTYLIVRPLFVMGNAIGRLCCSGPFAFLLFFFFLFLFSSQPAYHDIILPFCPAHPWLQA